MSRKGSGYRLFSASMSKKMTVSAQSIRVYRSIVAERPDVRESVYGREECYTGLMWKVAKK